MAAEGPSGRREYVLFVYDAWMSGQPGASRLGAAKPGGPAKTEPKYELFDLGTEVALVPAGATAVSGEVYTLDAAALASLDIEKGHPLRFRRIRIRLEDGREAEAYTLDPDQVRGRRRIRSGSYTTHVTPSAPERPASAWSKWAKTRR